MYSGRMLKKISILLFVAFAGSTCASAQQSDNSAKSSFDEFRKGLLKDYSSFRDGILADYAKFLDGVWVEYNGFRGESRDDNPKPDVPPTAPVSIPDTPKPVVLPEPEPVVTPAPEPRQEPVATTPKPVQRPVETKPFVFQYCGIDMEMPQIDLRLMERVSAPADFASQWRMLDASSSASTLISAISDLSKKLNFNGYLTYDLATAYCNAYFPGVSASSRTSLVHYIMTHLGYDARIGVNTRGQALIMFPSVQTIYGRMYFRFGNEKYYVFTDPSVTLSAEDMSVATCELPAAAAKAAKLDLRLGTLNIPYEPHPFKVSYGGLEITGETNAKLFPILFKYPQMPIGDYAESNLMPELRRSIVDQLKGQLEGKSRVDAVNTLLQFVQSGFEYATDHEYHGFEKPYFFEEILYYPKCDCEDRVIFYTYLLWNVLGVENHLIAYPGHESASVKLADIDKGDAYTYNGGKFYISDPTYIGSKTGMCMPSYRTTSPEIAHIYK